MKIAFYVPWEVPDEDFNNKASTISGELYLTGDLCKYLMKFDGVECAKVYGPNKPVDETMDIMIYMANFAPMREKARAHVLYMQMAWADSIKILEDSYSLGYDGYLFYSGKLYDYHMASGRDGLFLPFGVDTEIYYPAEFDENLAFEVSYAGNNIKGSARTMRYLYPAVIFDFGLFGKWRAGTESRYLDIFKNIERGYVPREKLRALFCSTKVNLNFALQGAVDMDTITMRTLEVLACGGFVISDRTPVAERELKDCVVFTDGGDDLVDKIRYYLAREDERKEIAARGYDYVMKHASTEARAKELYGYLKKII
jgi:spore maturation protein CgeB